MRTLALLAALLLALLAQAQTTEGRADMDPSEDQPEDDMVVSFTGEGRFVREAARPKGKICRCAPVVSCKRKEQDRGYCIFNGQKHRLCCSELGGPRPRTRQR